MKMATCFATFTLGATSFAIIGGLTNFHHGRSAKVERAFTMLRLVFDMLAGPFFDALRVINYDETDEKSFKCTDTIFKYVLPNTVSVCAPKSIGSLVIEIYMLQSNGSCTVINDLAG